MAIELTSVNGLPEIDLYRQVSMATGSRLVHIAGQLSWDAAGDTVGVGDLAAQVEQCYLDIGKALAQIGGSFDDIANPTAYVADWTPDKMPTLGEGIARAFARLGITAAPPATPLGVAALDLPDHLIEVTATAILG
ncbi:RidA family protein [Nocardia sp. NBC_01009]|uniref:RidA family protein n=1 Tax=Nocardia sp. NBC_01009 TaxID=2975996 RepID=UPI003863377C|nr:RidA family protein [Nocardia sp. NBC_01009]